MSRMTRRTVIPVNQITPLRYRDGVTYIQLLTELSEYIKSILHPSLQHTVDQLVADVEVQMDKHHDQYVDGVQEFQRIHDAFMSDVNAHLIALNDGAVSDLVNDDTSLLGTVLRNIFVSQTDFTELDEQLTWKNTQFQNHVEQQISSTRDYVNTEVENVQHELKTRSTTPQDYGAQGDGVTDDTEALHAFFDDLANTDTVSHGFIPNGRYLFTEQINLTGHTHGFSVSGASKHGVVLLFRGSGAPLMGQDVHDAEFRNFTIDGGRLETGNITHGISLRRPKRLVFDNVHIDNYGNSSMLLFAEHDDVGDYGDITLNNTSADGRGVANNGLNVVKMVNVIGSNNTAYNGGTDDSNSPSYGIQLKNHCRNVHLTNSVATGWKGGIVFATDSGQGPVSSSLTGTAIDCDQGVVFGAVQDNYADVRVVAPRERAVAFGNRSERNVVKVVLNNVNTQNIPIRHGYHNNTVIIEGMVNVTNSRIVELTPSTTYNKNYFMSMENIRSNPSELVRDNSNRTTNQTMSLGQMADLVATNTSMQRVLRFDMEGRSSFIAISASGTWNFRADGDDIFTANMGSMAPAHDNRQSLGRAGTRWSQIYAANGAINTSDETEKTEIQPIDDAVLDAWADVDYVSFKWLDSIERKGRNARTHFGVIAQHVRDVFERHGLDGFSYGVLCQDTITDEQGDTVTRLGIRYDQAMVLEAALNRRQWKRIGG